MDKDCRELLPPIVLAFAASDPSGGAGVQADIMTLSSMGCHPVTVITAITVQDSAGVEGMLPIDADWVANQARVLLEDMPIAAFKLGLLGSVENIAAIAEVVSDYPNVPLVLDPVLFSGRGEELTTEKMVGALIELLLPRTTLLTPNSIEARRLVIREGEGSEPDLAECADQLVSGGAEYVLVTGTHENSPNVVNTLYGNRGRVRADSWERLPESYHGSGCTLASAVAAGLASGLEIIEAVWEAQNYTWHTLKRGYRPGMGQFFPDRFFWARGVQSDEIQAWRSIRSDT